VITPAMPLDRVLTALRHCTDRDLRAMFGHCQQRADEATETGYMDAGALFAALADLVMVEQLPGAGKPRRRRGPEGVEP
jgi:hypothetical protein